MPVRPPRQPTKQSCPSDDPLGLIMGSGDTRLRVGMVSPYRRFFTRHRDGRCNVTTLGRDLEPTDGHHGTEVHQPGRAPLAMRRAAAVEVYHLS
jgi:hypothetical protein